MDSNGKWFKHIFSQSVGKIAPIDRQCSGLLLNTTPMMGRPKPSYCGLRGNMFSWKFFGSIILSTQLKYFKRPKPLFIPIGSMYGIFTYIYHKNQPNVGKYTYPMDPMGLKQVTRPLLQEDWGWFLLNDLVWVKTPLKDPWDDFFLSTWMVDLYGKWC